MFRAIRFVRNRVAPSSIRNPPIQQIKKNQQRSKHSAAHPSSLQQEQRGGGITG